MKIKRFRIPRRQKVFAVLPTLLTLGNAACGFGAITFAAKVGLKPVGWGGSDTDCLWIAAILIFLAMVFDMLDGRAARWAKQTSEFGAQLDSLCDAVSFGVAPAVILIKFTAESEPPMLVARLLWVIAVLFVVCAILRLARFNVETDEEDTHEYFSGLPSPAAAGTVASFMIALPELESLAKGAGPDAGAIERTIHSAAASILPALQFVLPIVALACACLMVSRVRYSHVFNQWFRGRRSYRHILQLVLGLAIAIMVKELAVPLIFCIFSFESPLRAAWRALSRSRPAPGETPGATESQTPQPPQLPGPPLPT
ncbi:MAG: CDP-diacylglycerol--serine O-phosphatidyltransferase [Planctomycetia bacterium]|nr:CDP-diacylglycerol--serine O-phosphatidyltransferase [Planctomycetia bacterium]